MQPPRIPAPHVVAARAYRMANTSGSSGSSSCILNLTGQTPSSVSPSSQEKTPLYRLAKLLNQSAKIQNPPTPKDDAPRRLSWER